MEKKSVYIIGGAIIGVLVLLLVIVWFMTNVRPTKYTYDELETKIYQATEKYYHKNPNLLPTQDGTYNLSYDTLVSNEMIKPLSEIVENGQNCSANIIVIKNGNDYSYIPYVNCGSDYTTKELYKQVLYDSPVVTVGSGLYKTIDNEYYFKGKISNNYVSFGSIKNGKDEEEIIWQIVSIKNNQIKLRAVKKLKFKTQWDNRYNNDTQTYVGYNDFDLSILSEYLSNVQTNYSLLKDTELAKIVPQQLCIGSRSKEDVSIDGRSECAKLSQKTYYYGTITPYEIIRSSLDENCKTIESRSCSNYNYLADLGQSEEWTTIPTSLNNYQALVFNGGTFELENAKNQNSVYPTIVLNRYAFFKSGNGTLEDPYRIK